MQRGSSINLNYPFNNNFNIGELDILLEKDNININNTSFNNSIELKENESNSINNFELIDYLFSICINNELNSVQGGYLVKIIISLIHSMYSPQRSSSFIKYVCYKKKNEILLKILNKINYNYFQEIILEILLYNNEEENNNGIIEMIKTNLMSYFIIQIKNNNEDIINVFCDYIDLNKNMELILNESILNKLFMCFNNINKSEKNLYNFCHICIHLIKEYKIEYNTNNHFFSSSKLINLSFKSPQKNANNNNEKILNNSGLILNMDENTILINKIITVIKEFNLSKLKNTFIIYNFHLFISNIISVTRCIELLETLQNINYFLYFKEHFFNKKNDLIQNILIEIIIIIVEEGSEKFIKNCLFKNNFVKELITITSKKNFLFVHISKIFEICASNNLINNLMKYYNIEKDFYLVYNKFYKDYNEILKTPLADFKNNSLYLSGILSKTINEENEIKKVDEIDNGEMLNENNNIKTTIDSNRNLIQNYNKKNNFFLTMNNIEENLFVHNNDNNDHIEKLEESDEYDDENDKSDNKKIIQIIPMLDDSVNSNTDKK